MTDFDRQQTMHLYRNADATGVNMVDDSILARIMAVDGTVADYNDNTMSLEAVAAAISAQDIDIAKVPHSDGTATFNATALASVNAEVDTALNTAVPLTPTANSLNDILSKLDGANTFDNTTDSLEAISEAIVVVDGLHDVPAADSANDANIRDVVGKKDDAGVEVVGTTKSLVAYSKGLVQEMAQRNVAMCAQNGATSTTWVDIVNINDKGVLTGLAAFTYAFTATSVIQFAVTIDGTLILSFPILTFTGIGQSNSLSYNHRFDTSLQVQINIGSDSKGAAIGIVSYTKDT